MNSESMILRYYYIYRFIAVYIAFEDQMNVGRLVSMAISWTMAFWFFTLSLPNLSAYLILTQCIDVTSSMLKVCILIRILCKMVCNSMLFLLQNFHTTTLPQSKNGRLIREKYQPTPPPSYKSVEYALNGIELIFKCT